MAFNIPNMLSRSQKKIQNNLGVIAGDTASNVKKHRRDDLDVLNQYFDNTQYNGLSDWEMAKDSKDQYIPIRKRKPRVIVPLSKMLACRVASKLIGHSVFPKMLIEEDPDATLFFSSVIKSSEIKSKIIDPAKAMLVTGSVFMRFFLNGPKLELEWYNSNNCYPEFDDQGELERVRVQYVFTDREDIDEHGRPKEKWFRLDVSKTSDTLYDNPEFKDNAEPVFKPVNTVEHNLGFVQGEWFRTTIKRNEPDGYSLLEDILPLVDELSYSRSQTSTTISYNQDPQVWFKGMDEEEINTLIRSSTKSWNLGRNGEVGALETNLNATQVAEEDRDKVRLLIQDVVRVIMLDPEKVVGHAQSAKAMEVLHGPMIELIDELRPVFQKNLVKMVQKMSLVMLFQASRNIPTPIQIPPGYTPSSFDLVVNWPKVFPMTMQDLLQKVQVVTSATSANVISRETGTRYLAEDFGVENVEEEIQKIADQPVINPFGAF